MPGDISQIGNQGLARLAMLAAVAGLLMTAGSAQESPARADVRQRGIDLSKARTTIQPPTAEVIRNLEARVVAAPATEVGTGPATVATAAVPGPEVVPQLESGKLYHVELAAGDESIIAKQLASQSALQTQGNALVTLPGAYRQLAADGTELQLKPFVIAQRLSFDAATRMFVGSIKIGVHEISGPAARKSLTAPISFQVLTDGTASPEELLVDHSGFPLSNIKIAAPQIEGRLTISVASPFNPEGLPVDLELAPSFSLRLPRTIEGLGLQAATVSVTATGLAKPKDRPVQLTVDGPAYAEVDQLYLNSDGNAWTKLRTIGVGTVTVTAQTAGFAPAQAETRAILPVLTFVSSILGGLVGGLIRLLPSLRRNSGRRFWLGLAVALLVGLLVFGLYAVGVNVLPIRPTVQQGAMVVAVVSAMGAFLGSGVLGAPAPAEE